jgi:hypothetical protein
MLAAIDVLAILPAIPLSIELAISPPIDPAPRSPTGALQAHFFRPFGQLTRSRPPFA